jgi:predicted dehydrogenase
LQQAEGLRLVAIATSRSETAATIRTRFGLPTTADLDDLLMRNHIDAVVIATPPERLAELTVAALQAGKHVFCETPGIETPEEVDSVNAALASSGRVLVYGTCLRYAPIYRKLRSSISAVRTADGLVLSLRYYPSRHSYDLALYLLGDVAEVETLRIGKQPIVALRFADGDLGIVHGLDPVNGGLPLEQVEITSSRGLLSARGGRELWSYAPLKDVNLLDVDFETTPATVWSASSSIPFGASGSLALRGYIPELECFAQAIHGGGPTLSGLDQAERTLRLKRAVVRSVEEGRRVEVEPSSL